MIATTRIVTWGRLAVLVAVGGAVAAGLLLRDDLSRELIEQQVAMLGAWAPIVFVVIYAAATVALLPGLLFTIASGALFGPFVGAACSLAGAIIGAVIAFLIARYMAGDRVARYSGRRLGRLRQGVDREGWRFVAFTRLVPIFPYNLLNYALGLTRIGLRPYAITSFICMAPGTLAYAWLGYAGAEVITGGGGAVRAALIALALLATAAFLPRLIRRIRNDSLEEADTALERDSQRTSDDE